MRNTRATALLSSLFATLSAFAQPAPQPPSQPCPEIRDVLVTNGKIHTLNATNTVVDSVRIVGDRFAEVGTNRLGTSRCTRMIDLEGRTVVPGLIDNHNHIVLLGLRPGHDTRLESAASIDDVLSILRAKAATLPNGEWLTSIGGFDINQFVPPPGAPRFPTLAELDSATPNHPVYLATIVRGPVSHEYARQAVLRASRHRGRRRRRNGRRLPDAESDDARAARAAAAANACRSEARHARRDALRGELGTHDASRRRRFSGDGHGRRRRRAHGSLPRLRRPARALRRGRADEPHSLELPAHGDRRRDARARGAPRECLPALRRRSAQDRRHRRVHGGRLARSSAKRPKSGAPARAASPKPAGATRTTR